ncbi:MAG: hypothetical protein HQL59_06260 [Magnetococcales bacterium]|nr:hypothetical protein [Magnetococcales bacterium]
MLTFADRVKESASVTGAAAYQLTGAAQGYQGFVAALGNGAKCAYCAESGSQWEVSEGTVDAAAGTLSRDRILASSNGGTAVAWPAGNVALSCVAPASVIQRSANAGVTLSVPGTLQLKTDATRWYPPQAVSFRSMDAWLGTASAGAAVQFTLRKSGLIVTRGSIPVGWREPVECTLYYDTLANAQADMRGDNIFDGEAVHAGMRVLLLGLINGVPSNVYLVAGTAGNWTLTEDAQTATQGDRVYSSGGGTFRGRYWEFNGSVWNLIDPPAWSQRLEPTALDLSLTPTQWLSLDITRIGSTTPGADLAVRLV